MIDVSKYKNLQDLNDFVDPQLTPRTHQAILQFGMTVFMQSTLYKEFNRIMELSLLIESEKFNEKQRTEFANLGHTYLVDCIIILMFFENYIKAELIKKNYLVHVISGDIDKLLTLKKAQINRPISLDELNKLEPFVQFQNTKKIRNLGLTNQTVSIGYLLRSKRYLNILDDKIPVNDLREMNKYRNNVHLYYSASYNTITIHQFEYIKKVAIEICRKNNIILKADS